MSWLSLRLLFFAAILVWLVPVGSAGSITLGLPPIPSNGNCIPFSCPVIQGLTEFQQVYTSTAFSGNFDIAGIEFFNTQDPGGPALAGGTYTLSLSYTSAAVGSLSTTSPASNVGSGSQVFFTGSLGSLIGGAGGVLLFHGTPFLYNPTDGNLLLSITFTGASDSSFVFLDQSSSGSATEFVAFTTSGPAAENGLVTEFISTPEPSAFFLGTTGLLAMVRIRTLRQSAGRFLQRIQSLR